MRIGQVGSTLALMFLLSSPSFAGAKYESNKTYSGPDHIQMDLLRPSEGGNRIMVQAILPDGKPGLFMIDTGADISVLTQNACDRLKLDVDENWGIVEGLSGTASMDRSVIPWIQLGGATVSNIEVAVNLAGVGEQVAGMPFAGILGNNVWSNFTLEIDYPADTLVLHRPGSFKAGKNSGLLIFDGSHILTPVKVTTKAKPVQTNEIIIQVDTGASELLLSGRTGLAFENNYSEGVEPLWGIGASETLPPYRFLQKTRRVAVSAIEFGGQKSKVDIDARWVNFDTLSPVGPTTMRGLIGHRLLSDYNVILDYHQAQIALTRSKRKHRQTNAHQILIEQDQQEYGDDPTRFLLRAQLQAGSGDYEASVDLLKRYLEVDPTNSEARVFLARLYREQGHLKEAWDHIQHLSVEGMVDESEIVAAVNGLLLEGDSEEAFLLADDATTARSSSGWAHVALADVLLSKGFPDRARHALIEAAQIEENPDAHLLRRARVAVATGDRHGAIAHIRKLVQLYPSGGPFLWYYALLIEDPVEIETFLIDLEGAMSRLHPARQPFDFLVAAYHTIGRQEESINAMRDGLERDCTPMDNRPLIDNCYAWYWALAGVKTDDALKKIDSAIETEGLRSDFLDTKAMVHLARGEYLKASEAAATAARMSPQDVYMLWQAERIDELAQGILPK